jgi:hypothetical protein
MKRQREGSSVTTATPEFRERILEGLSKFGLFIFRVVEDDELPSAKDLDSIRALTMHTDEEAPIGGNAFNATATVRGAPKAGDGSRRLAFIRNAVSRGRPIPPSISKIFLEAEQRRVCAVSTTFVWH